MTDMEKYCGECKHFKRIIGTITDGIVYQCEITGGGIGNSMEPIECNHYEKTAKQSGGYQVYSNDFLDFLQRYGYTLSLNQLGELLNKGELEIEDTDGFIIRIHLEKHD